MAAPTPALIKWLTRFLSDLTEEGPVTRFELLHKIEGEHAERLEVWRNQSDSPRDPEEFGQEIQDTAERDLQTRTTGQPQRYVVYVYRGELTQHESQHAFLLRPPLQLAKRGEDSEPPTEKGVVAHYMRHDENVHRLLMSAGDSLIGKLATEVDRERGARLKAEELNWSMFEKYQLLLDKDHERRVAEAKELMKARRMDELMGVVTALLPIFAARFIGGQQSQPPAQLVQSTVPAPPELVDPKDAAVRHFFACLSETEISSILGCLGSSNQIALAELHRAFSDGAPGAADVMVRHLAIRKFLKGLSERELTAIFASLSEPNRNLLVALYAEYRKLEEEEQSRKPEILRS
ncbi:MAG TPA: hypothetical protein VG937_00120 [Polyangiaceae bacterium]|nr:hypothetical protein [Polyangiaceae bacterium]